MEKPKYQLEKEGREEVLVRIFSTDIPGSKGVYAGLTKIKGISWAISNAICHILNLDRKKKISSFTEAEIEKINEFLKNPKVPEWLLNRRKDRETGVSQHKLSTELDMTKEWDIRRLKKIKSYKGWRHALGQPVRGQRTKSHFREKGKSLGVKRAKSGKK